jgi:sugar phosphate isomerase/epimerase
VLLSLALTGLPIPDARERITSAAEAAARAEVPALHLDATLPGIRPRELDRSARRDLLAIVKRHNVSLTGCDLFIPPTHFTSPQHQQRAADAVRQAIGLAAELRSLGAAAAMVCIETAASVAKPNDPTVDPAALLTDLAAHARDHGVTLCDCTSDSSPLARGLDLAAVLARNEDPAAAILTHKPACLRLADWNGRARVPFGDGRADATSIAAATSVATPDAMGILDFRGVRLTDAASIREAVASAASTLNEPRA